MNNQEKKLFEALSEDRSESADMLEKPSMRGVKNSVVEKYSDQAHFIYELLQNADDAKATTARFILEKDRLIFAHNGSRHFSVSDVHTEDHDSEAGKLGDINAITSIANSNKTEASIGKFGVGFKAVFQYTTTPYIYGPDFKFKIERFIVPIILENDFPGRKNDETLFVFPFDHPDRNELQAYIDIATKLQNLSYPLLFLTGLKDISFEFEDVVGLYGKEVKEKLVFENTEAEQICLTQNNGNNIYDINLWLFTRRDSSNRKYSVGFFMDKEGNLKAVRKPAFCYFPTKEVTNLNFIIHAPFLLTDSREGIRAGILHNERLIEKLSLLAADSLIYLRDIGMKKEARLIEDNIFDIIPISKDMFSDVSDKSKISFMPFYDAIKQKFESSELLPTKNGYISSENAYWAAMPQLTQLFSDKQLGEIVENENAHWVFTSMGRDEIQRNNRSLFHFLDPLVKTNINEDIIITGRSKEFYFDRKIGQRKYLVNIKGISPKFIEMQSINWLHRFYKWISETNHRTEIAKKAPIFLDENLNAVAAYDNQDNLILFLPASDMKGYRIINKHLLKNEDTLNLVKSIGIKEPSLKDYIYNVILPMYDRKEDIDADAHFQLFFKYFCACSNAEVDEFVKLIKEYPFLRYYDAVGVSSREKASLMYLPTSDLKCYFDVKRDTKFIAFDEYEKIVGVNNTESLKSFLRALGIKEKISIFSRKIDYLNEDRADLPYPNSSRACNWEETYIDGCKEILQYIEETHDSNRSIVLWNSLIKIMEQNCSHWNSLDSIIKGKVSYFYRKAKVDYFVSSDILALRETKWLLNRNGNFEKPDELNIETISECYDMSSEFAERLLDCLGVKKEVIVESDTNENLTDEQREKIALADKLKEFGITSESDLEEFREFKKQKDKKKAKEIKEINTNQDFDIEHEDVDSDKSKVIRDIVKKTSTHKHREHNPSVPVKPVYEEELDQDEFMPTPVDYSKKIERAKEKSAAEIDRITYYESLQQRVLESEKYSYGWFKVLLEMECLNSGETNANSKEVSISFGKVEKEENTKRTLVLKHPNRYIPQFMEDLADIPLVLHFSDHTKTIPIEVANINSYTLRVKLKSSAEIENIDLSQVNEATINAKSPAFLLEELRNAFQQLAYDDNFNMQENLCDNIEFIFGPPGTGKTTYLAKDILIPMMEQKDDCKVLVLTPTNKSADVLVKRIMDVLGDDDSYNDWLIRFGATGDEEIEQSPIFRDKTFDIRELKNSVTVTTIARFPYDFFMPKDNRIFLNGMNWDYIVIDEASMIPIVNIIYPLYKKTPQKFIIAGDPFQIEPITSVDLWKNENIYTMVHLDSFTNPKTVPYDYKIKLLTTQYRSIPDIGRIFSEFAYDGILKHNRTSKSQRELHIENELDIQTLNIIKYPVSKYESIYRCKRLQHSSSYQVYSALFTFEFVCYLSKVIAKNNPDQFFKIGIIAPYRAQADMIDKLLASERLPDQVDVQVGTIHSFQGDECDIIFAVFNTPPTISTSKEMFLNKKNIINVSISRARDYLFVVMPDDNTPNISNLRLINRVENLIHKSSVWKEMSSESLEQVMFNEPNYIEQNAFSTSHQNVNVYGLPEKRYEIRTEETAVDVQLHK